MEVDTADSMSDLTFNLPNEPDAQATVTDFVDYTELFPSDLIRSLTLIGKLDRTYKDAAARVNELTTTFGSLPKLPPDQRPDPQVIRKEISLALDHALACREATFAEASRLSTVAERHCTRLSTIKTKLEAMPEPPSRDPTPPPPSPQTTRSRRNDQQQAPRIAVHLSDGRGLAGRPKHKNIFIPGDVLPAGAELAYSAAATDDEDSFYSSDENVADLLDPAGQGGKPGRVKVPKAQKQRQKSHQPARVRPPGYLGTNVHSAVAGISTSNALALLAPPPPEAKPGSMHRPWFKLTEWEMAKLRKMMKKNAIWTPSDTMIRRELDKDARGRENYENAKALAEANGEPFIDENPVDPTKTALAPGEISYEKQADANELVNRGMRLNEAKKQKKEKELQELEEANRRIAAVGDTFKHLFSTPVAIKLQQPPKSKKRKRDTDKESSPSERTSPTTVSPEGPKKVKLTQAGAVALAPKSADKKLTSRASSPGKVVTTQVPLAPAGPSSPARSAGSRRNLTPGLASADFKKSHMQSLVQPTAAQSRSRRTSGGTKPETPVVPALTPPKIEGGKELRPRSRGSLVARPVKAASAEPQSKRADTRELRELRRASVVETKPTPEPVAVTRTTRGRRPAPGLVTGIDEDGKGKVSVGKRRAAPKRTVKFGADMTEDKKENEKPSVDEEPDDVDPDEPRYCLCNGVSWGTMIACENEQVCILSFCRPSLLF